LSEHGFWIDCTNRKTVLIDNQILHRQEEWIANAFRWSGKQYLMCPANAVPRYEFGRRPTSVAGLNRIDVRRKKVFVFVLDDTYTWIRRENGGRNISGALLTAGRSTF
jgi:hypothetical protein